MKPAISAPLRYFLLLLVILVPTLVAGTASAETDPLRLSLLNAAANGGAEAHGALNDIIKKSDQIDPTPQSDVYAYAGREFGLEEKSFRSSALRAQNEANFRRLMKDLNLEALLIVDVYKKGKAFQLVAIGPNGKEVADIRRDIDRGQLTEDDAKGVLQEAFADLVPLVLEFREAGGWSQVEEEEEEEEVISLSGGEGEEEEEDGELSLKEEAIRDVKQASDLLASGARLQAGLLLGRRSITMTSDEGFELTHESPFAGFGAKVDIIFAQLGSDSALGANVFGGYAPFTTIFDESLTFPSQYARVGADVEYLRGFSPEFILSVFGGAEATSITIDSNPHYTGNRYVSARAGVGVLYQVGPVLLQVDAAVLPVFGVNNSDGAYGEAEGLSIAFEPAGGLSFAITNDISVLLRYSGQFYSVGYVSPNPALLSGPASSSDGIHTGLIAIGYGL